jgi:hypothetical protein
VPHCRPGYNAAVMECLELAGLRVEASRCFREFNHRRRRAREQVAKLRGQQQPGVFVRPGDFEGYLQRRLAKMTASIESHVALHHCQD